MQLQYCSRLVYRVRPGFSHHWQRQTSRHLSAKSLPNSAQLVFLPPLIRKRRRMGRADVTSLGRRSDVGGGGGGGGGAAVFRPPPPSVQSASPGAGRRPAPRLHITATQLGVDIYAAPASAAAAGCPRDAHMMDDTSWPQTWPPRDQR